MPIDAQSFRFYDLPVEIQKQILENYFAHGFVLREFVDTASPGGLETKIRSRANVFNPLSVSRAFQQEALSAIRARGVGLLELYLFGNHEAIHECLIRRSTLDSAVTRINVLYDLDTAISLRTRFTSLRTIHVEKFIDYDRCAVSILKALELADFVNRKLSSDTQHAFRQLEINSLVGTLGDWGLIHQDIALEWNVAIPLDHWSDNSWMFEVEGDWKIVVHLRYRDNTCSMTDAYLVDFASYANEPGRFRLVNIVSYLSEKDAHIQEERRKWGATSKAVDSIEDDSMDIDYDAEDAETVYDLSQITP